MTLPIRCPCCGRGWDQHDCPADPAVKPAPGDITICLYCGAVATYTDDLNVRPLTPEEEARLPDDVREQADRIEMARRQVMERLRPPVGRVGGR